jgi:hypothetical protein
MIHHLRTTLTRIDSRVCGFMHAFWTIPDCAKLHKCGVGEHGVQKFEVLLNVLLLSFDVFVLTSAHHLSSWDIWFVHMCVNVTLHMELCANVFWDSRISNRHDCEGDLTATYSTLELEINFYLSRWELFCMVWDMR